MFSLAAMMARSGRLAAVRLHYIVPDSACRRMRMPAGAARPGRRPARGMRGAAAPVMGVGRQ